MSEEHKEGREPQTGAEHKPEGGADSPDSEGGEGARNAAATPDISVEGEHEQTAVNAPEGDAEKAADSEHRREE
jgi:hypothetical protein